MSDAGQAQITVGTSALVYRGVDTPSFAGSRQISPTQSTTFTVSQGAALRGATDNSSTLQPGQTVNYIVKI